MNPLDGARFKIMRAEGQLHALQDEIAWFMVGDPYIAI